MQYTKYSSNCTFQLVFSLLLLSFYDYLYIVYMFISVCVCVCMCVCVCPCCQPPLGGHGNTSSACLMMWLMAASLSLTVWWRPGGVRGPSCWSCKPTMGIHHAYTSYNARGSACTWTRSFDPGPWYYP